METTIYLDILLCTNFLINFLLLSLSGKILRLKSSRFKVFLSASLGALYSLIILIEGISPIILNLSKIIMMCVMVLVAYSKPTFKLYIKRVLVFYLCSVALSGIIMLLEISLSPTFMSYQNGVLYFDISASILVLITGALYFAVSFACRFFRHTVSDDYIYKIKISLGGKTAILFGLFDSGNQLRDTISGLPVIVCELEKIKKIIPEDSLFLFKKGISIDSGFGYRGDLKFKLIPFSSVSGSGLITAFKPDFVEIDKDGKKTKITEILVGVGDVISGKEFDAILPKEAINL